MSDYQAFLHEYGLTEDYVQSLVQNTDDQCDLDGVYDIELKESLIHGLGAFAMKDIAEHTLIAPARLNGKRTIAGRYVNHSDKPNAQFFPLDNGDLHLIATFNINKGDEITIDYRQAMSVNGAGLEPVNNYLPALIRSYGIDTSGMTYRQITEVVEYCLLRGNNIVDELPIREFVFGGMYAREMTIPAGVALTGKIHNEDHFCIVSQGDISVITDNGYQRITAPAIFETKAGIKKLGYAHTDTVFTTIHATELTDKDEISAASMHDGDISWINELVKRR